MKNWIKIVIGLTFLGIVSVALIYFFVYNKPHPNYENLTPDFYMQSQLLYDEFKVDLDVSNILYTGKMIQISGNISGIEDNDSLKIIVFAFEEGMFGDEGVRCVMLPETNIQLNSFAKNQYIEIKGYCTGFNGTDVILEKCSLNTDK